MMRNVAAGLILFWLTALTCTSTPLAAQSLSGGNVSLEMSRDGSVQAVRAGHRLLPAGGGPGGIFIRDLADANVPGTMLFSDSFEGVGGHGWEYYQQTQNQALTIRTSDHAAHTGQRSLLFKVEQAASNQKGRILSPESLMVPVEPGKRYRLQCLYKATRGYLAANPGSLTIQSSLYEPSNGNYINGIGLFWLDSTGIPVAEHINVAPFMDQANDWKSAGGVATAPDEAAFARVTVSASLFPDYDLEGFFVDQVEFFEDRSILERVLGSLTTAGKGNMAFASKLDDFQVEVDMVSLGNGLMFSGTVRALDSKPHPLDLHIAIPVDAEGWTWPLDAEEKEIIDSKVSSWYANEISFDSQSNLPASLYPYGGVHDDESGIALCIPLEPVQVASIGYAASRRCLEARFRLGLDPGLGRGTARFTAFLFDFPPEHGFRGIISSYRKLFWFKPDWFAADFDPAGFKQWIVGMFHSIGGARLSDYCDKNGYFACQHTGTELIVEELVQVGQQPPPTLDQILQVVAHRAGSSDPLTRYYYTYVWEELLRSHNGDPVLRACEEDRSANGWIQAFFRLTPCVHLDDEGFIRYLRELILFPAFNDTMNPDPSWNVDPSVLDAVLLDHFLNQSSMDFNPAHIVRSAQDLTYSQNSYQLGLTPSAGARDLVLWLRRWLDYHVPEPRRQIMVNWFGLGTCNAVVPWVDLYVDEVNNAISNGQYGYARENAFDPAILRYRRAIVYQKYRCQKFNGTKITRSDVHDTLHTYLLFAMGAIPDERIKFKNSAQFGWDQLIATVEFHNAMAADMHNAGWEPVTHADCDAGEIRLERYGEVAGGAFYIVALNESESAVSGTITLRGGLGLGKKPEVTELISGTKYTVNGSGPEWTVDFQRLVKRRALVLKIE